MMVFILIWQFALTVFIFRLWVEVAKDRLDALKEDLKIMEFIEEISARVNKLEDRRSE